MFWQDDDRYTGPGYRDDHVAVCWLVLILCAGVFWAMAWLVEANGW